MSAIKAIIIVAILAVACDAGSASEELVDGDEQFPGVELLPNVVIIGWDGVQWDHLQECRAKELAECPDGLPHLEALSGGEVLDSITTTAATETKPGWVEILTGYDATRFGVFDNDAFDAVPRGHTVLERLEAAFGDEVATLFIAGKTGHVGGHCHTEPKQPWCKVKIRVDYFENRLEHNDHVGQLAKMLLKAHADEPIAAFLQFWDPDHTGHDYGEDSAEYSEKIVDDDRWLGKLVALMEELGILERTLIYVISDHGFDEGGAQHHNAPYAFLATNDPFVVRGGDRKDLAPTILERFGLPLGADGDLPALDGVSLSSIPEACVEEGRARHDYPGAPDCCSGLERIGLIKDRKPEAVSPDCLDPTGKVGDESGFCTRCGDGQCAFPENRCNCPADCTWLCSPSDS